MADVIRTCKVAVLSDTHGLLRPEVLDTCEGVDAILHAGDVGDAAILNQLGKLAPVTAIRGNIDKEGRCADLPATEMVEIEGITFYLIHSLSDLDIDPVAAHVQVVVSGHSHIPKLERRHGVLYLNPGSVGPKRFRLPVSMAILTAKTSHIEVQEVCLNV